MSRSGLRAALGLLIVLAGGTLLMHSASPPTTAASDREEAAVPPTEAGIGEADITIAPPRPGTSPAAVLGRLRAAAAAGHKLADGLDRNVVIELRGGTYQLDAPLRLTAAHSGDDDSTIVWRARKGEVPILSRGRIVDGWEPTAGVAWTAQLGTDIQPRQLYVNGRRAVRARSVHNPAGFAPTASGFTSGIGGMENWANIADVEVVGSAAWRDYRCGVTAVVNGELHLDEPCRTFANNDPPMERVSWIENAGGLLDEPGEWYHDRRTGEVQYLPREGERLGSADVVASGGSEIIIGTAVHHVRFDGLTFAHTGWQGPDEPAGYAPVQTGWLYAADGRLTPVPGALRLSDAYEIDVTANTFRQLGTAAVVLDRGSRQVRIGGNRIDDVSSHGISVGTVHDAGVTDPHRMHRDITLSDNRITRIGREFRDSVGIFLGYVRDTHVVHNEIVDAPYSGIAMGWGWGRPSYAQRNRVANNRIDRFLQSLNDGGGVYTLGPQPGTSITGNHVTRNAGKYGCLYPDEGSSGMQWHGNVCAQLGNGRSGTGRWLHIWAEDIHDLAITGNVTDTAELENDGTDILLEDNVVADPPSQVPAAAEIIRAVGPRRTLPHLPDG